MGWGTVGVEITKNKMLQKKTKALEPLNSKAFLKLRGLDLNQRPSGYEPDELPNCSTLY